MQTLYNVMIVTIGGLSGGLLYFCVDDINKIFIKKERYFPTPLNRVNQLLNPGFFLGTTLGLAFAYTGKPLLSGGIEDIYDKLSNQSCSNQSATIGAK